MVLLYVDDDPEDVDVFCDAVKEIDETVKCVVAYNGLQALDILGSGLIPDYMFLDINMPIMNGLETLRRMRKDRSFKKVPVIIFSTTINPAEIDSYKKEGANCFLSKPTHFHELCDSIRGIIKSSL